MKLRATTKAITHINWNDLRLFLESLFGVKEFIWNDLAKCLIDCEKCERILIVPGDTMDNADRRIYARAKREGVVEGWGLRSLFLGLVEDGHLPWGDYLVHNAR